MTVNSTMAEPLAEFFLSTGEGSDLRRGVMTSECEGGLVMDRRRTCEPVQDGYIGCFF